MSAAARPTGERVLIVDDDPLIRNAVRDGLEDHGYVVTEAASGAEALTRVTATAPAVVLLDLGLPDRSGLDVLSDLLDSGQSIIVVSGRDSEADRVVGLELGADDYITKPFSLRELVARVGAVSRRRASAAPSPRTLRFDELLIDLDAREVTLDGSAIALTAKEFDLLSFLASEPRRVFSRDQLLEHVWASSGAWQSGSTISEHVHRVRTKLDGDDRTRWIETVRGVGYRFNP